MSNATEQDPRTAPLNHLGDDGFIGLRVAAVVHDTADSVIVTFDTEALDADIDVSFRHGQHITVRRWFTDADQRVEVRRSYSLCSVAPDGDLRIAIKRVDGGVFSTWAVDDLEAGEVLDVMPPTGRFTHDLDPAAARSYALIAGGSGITPIFSIAATVLDREPNSTVDLLYVNSTSASTMLLDELHDLRDNHLHRFRINFVFTRESSASELLSGRPDGARFGELIESGFLSPSADQVFMCGPEALLDTATVALTGAGLPPDRVHRELFTTSQLGQVRSAPQAVSATATPIATLTATLHGRGTQVDVYDGDTILEAVERVRPDAPYSCRAGVCSTCQASMQPGTVTMDTNLGLTDDEVARGFVLTCQARPIVPADSAVADLDVNFDV